MQVASVQLVNWFAVAGELHRDWRNDIEGFGGILANHLPHYCKLDAELFLAAEVTSGARLSRAC